MRLPYMYLRLINELYILKKHKLYSVMAIFQLLTTYFLRIIFFCSIILKQILKQSSKKGEISNRVVVLFLSIFLETWNDSYDWDRY